MLMWFSGAKLPFLLWFFVFLIAFCLILAVKLDEHGVQLIGMKLYSALWNWIDLDPNKRVNVTLPSGAVLRTVMPAVPYIPEVIRADRKSVVSGKSVSVRVDLGGRRIIKKKK